MSAGTNAVIAVIDYGAGNVPSVERALLKLGVESRRVTCAGELSGARAVVLPGVGHYAAMIRALDKQNLRGVLLDSISRGVPFLGICLGLQALYSSSAEAPSLHGLGWLAGTVQSLPPSVKLPHMGWNRLCLKRTSRLLESITSSDYFYFAHTFAAADDSNAVASCAHGADFAAVLERDNLFATQFHPEKSGAAGARLLQNFVRLAA